MAPSTLKRLESSTRDISPPAPKRKLTTAATTTQKAVANFFKPASERAPDKTTFKVLHDTLLLGRHDFANRRQPAAVPRIAAFDLDDTVIATQSGLHFARDAGDWRWWHGKVPERLRQLHADGYVVVLVSNQGGISLKAPLGSKAAVAAAASKSLAKFKEKLAAVLAALDLPVSIYAATAQDEFRKPRVGMWRQIVEDHGLRGETDAADGDHGLVDLDASFYVGDAAGRPEDTLAKARKDHSCSDRDFAANVGIAFHTPEEFFLGQTPRPFTRTFDPLAFLSAAQAATETQANPSGFVRKNPLELVLFCGSPGAGKSTFYWRHLQPLGYERVNQDILKSRPKCMTAASQFLAEGKSVAVDNTNADIETRAAWISFAAERKVPIRLVHFSAPSKLCEHNDTVRALGGDSMNPERRTMLPRVAFTGFAGRYREPQLQEGFEDITQVAFTLYGTDEQKATWARYWTS